MRRARLQLSVVIPTYNRANILRATLKSLCRQSLDKKLFEVVVIDDGSDDGTPQLVSELIKRVEHNVRYFWQPRGQAGTARNRGIKEARAGIVLLMDSDIVPNEDHLKRHLDLHLKYPGREVAVLGWITAGNGIELLRREERIKNPIGYAPGGEAILDASHFLTGDVSLKTDFVKQAGLFKPGLPVAQDMDLAERLRGRGLKLIYCPEAIAVHTEPLDTLDKVAACGRKYGRAFAEWYGRIPLFEREIWKLGGRFNGGWDHFERHPWGWIKDALRRWVINRCTIKPVIRIAKKIPVSNPPRKILHRLCMEIWAYYYRQEFKQARRRLKTGN